MTMSAFWFAPLAVTVGGAVAAVLFARSLGRDVAKLQASLRPLRARRGRVTRRGYPDRSL
jgi:hypothetical protein